MAQYIAIHDNDEHARVSLPSTSMRFGILSVAFIVSTSVLLSLAAFGGLVATRDGAQSDYARLSFSQQVPFAWSTGWSNANLTEAAELWEAIDFDKGIVALPYSWSDEMGLPRAQPFPWDASQGIYLLNGHHALHCLKNIHRAIREYELGAVQSLPLAHITHCLASLRDEILCFADDTPRYTTASDDPKTAEGQFRQCRDWAQLERWAEQRSACYQYISHKADTIDQFKRFMFCPRDSRYWTQVRAHFRKPVGWFADDFDDEVERARENTP